MNFMGPVVYAPPNSAAALRRSSSATIRKRSMPSGDLSRLSFAARKSESDKDLLGSLAPLGVVFMEQVTLDIDVVRAPHADVKYVMKVRHLKSNAEWSHARTFDDYRHFQQRLLKVLNHGHFCSAECPWLYTFLKSYFPKKHLFQFVTSRVVASRKESLQRFFVSLQGFLLNRANHNCSIVASAVVDAVVDFVYGSYARYYQLEGTSDNQRGGSFINKAPLRGSECAPCPEDDEASTASASSSTCGVSSAASVCMLCESSLNGEAYAASRSCASIVTSSTLTSTASSTSLVSDDSPMDTSDIGGTMSCSAPANFSALAAATTGRRGAHYIMTLGCGHQFHDECIVPKLNETLRCPTCDHLEVK